MREDEKNSRHLKHALILMVLWVPVLVLELSLFQGSGGLVGGVQKVEDPLLLLLVVVVSIGLFGAALWKLSLYFKFK